MKRKAYGKVIYKLYQLDRYNVKNKLLSHDEALSEINKSFSYSHHNTNLGIASNYPYVYKSSKHIIQDDIDRYKLLIIPSPELYGKPTISKFKQVILNDKYAFINELSKLLREPLINKGKNDWDKLEETYAQRIETGNVLMKSIDTTEKHLIGVNDEIFKKVPNRCHYTDMESWVQRQVNRNIHYLEAFKKFPMRGNTKFESMLQGRNSIIRDAIGRKMPAFRGQILLRPELRPNEVIFPYTWQQDMNVYADKLVDIESSNFIPKECMIYLGRSMRIGQKRDPAINADAYSFYDTVGFAKSNNIYIGPGELQNKNADFDGDTQASILFTHPLEILEIDMNILPQNNLRIYQQTRIAFTESHILYMHQRPLPVSCPHKPLYDYIKARETIIWMNNNANSQSLNLLNKKYPHINFYDYVEPTRDILQKVLSLIIELHGSRAGYDFFTYINNKTLELANGIMNDFHVNHLPNDYLMEDDMLCEPIIRACMSGAKGSIDTIDLLCDVLMKNDQTTKITSHVAKLDRTQLFSKLDNLNRGMANNSKQVQVHGHNFFKSNIGYDMISFDNGCLCYHGKVIRERLDFISHILLLSPDIAATILASPG